MDHGSTPAALENDGNFSGGLRGDVSGDVSLGDPPDPPSWWDRLAESDPTDFADWLIEASDWIAPLIDKIPGLLMHSDLKFALGP